ncbi:DMT family transporter [Aquamicrobium terrae]
MNTATGAIDRRDAIDLTATALMIGLTLSWGLNYVAAKISYTGFDPLFVSFVRAALGGALVFLWCLWRRIPLFEKDGTLLAGMAAGLLFGIEFLLLLVGLEHTTVARNTLLVNAMPFWMLLGGHFLLGEHFTARKLFGLLLAFAGMVVVFSDRLDGSGTLVGDVLSLGAGVVWAATNLTIKRSRLTSVSAEKVLLYQLAGAFVVSAVALPFAAEPIRSVTPVATAALLFQASYIVGFTFVLWFWLLRRYPASGLSSFAFLTPVFGVLCGALLLDEPLSWRIAAALLLIGVGLIIVNRPVRKQIIG